MNVTTNRQETEIIKLKDELTRLLLQADKMIREAETKNTVPAKEIVATTAQGGVMGFISERDVLGLFLLNPTRETFDELWNLELTYDKAKLYAIKMAMIYVYATTGTCDVISLAEYLNISGELEAVGGISELTRLTDVCARDHGSSSRL